MKLHKRKYPLTILMILSVLTFWISITVMGYELKIDGTLAKRVEENTEQADTENTTPPAEQPDTDTEEPDAVKEEPEEPAEEPEVKKEFITAEDDYLDGALFIGDSRTAVLAEYAQWEKTDFFVEYGLTAWDVMEKELFTDKETGEKLSLRELLTNRSYDKIYLMLGINELGRGTADSFYEQYKSVVDEIRTLQPDAVLFIQSIMHVSAEKDAQGTYINNAEINARNEKIKTLADSIHTFWLDENEVFDLEDTGTLNPDLTWDGVHLQAKYIPEWKEFFLTHAIEISPLAIQPED